MLRINCCSLSLFLLLAGPLHAGFILDDFDDPAQVVSPEMKNEFVETTGVGALNTTRNLRIAVIGSADPNGSLNADVTRESALTGRISRLNSASGPIVSVQSQYEFTPFDFTDGGVNNAFIFEFNRLVSEIQPAFFRVLLNDGTQFYEHTVQTDLRNTGPFVHIAPFNEFTIRGGTPGLPDYSTIESVSLTLRVSTLFGGGPDPLNFHVELDRIRVGRIPEASSLCMTVVLILSLTMLRVVRSSL